MLRHHGPPLALAHHLTASRPPPPIMPSRWGGRLSCTHMYTPCQPPMCHWPGRPGYALGPVIGGHHRHPPGSPRATRVARRTAAAPGRRSARRRTPGAPRCGGVLVILAPGVGGIDHHQHPGPVVDRAPTARLPEGRGADGSPAPARTLLLLSPGAPVRYAPFAGDRGRACPAGTGHHREDTRP